MLDLDLPPARLRPLKRIEYDRLIELGLLKEDERVELLYGRIVRMSPQGALHAYCITQLGKLLIRAVDDHAEVRIQLPLSASETSEPEPDVAVVAPGPYLEGHPSQALLVVEVAESSLLEDRNLKGRLYAECGFADFWIVNLPERLVEVHRDPRGGEYRRVTKHHPGERIRLLALADVELAVSDLLPPAK